MKPYILFFSLSLSLFGADATINKKIQNLENEITELKTQMNYHQDDLDERMPIIESIEMKSILDKINFSPELRLRFDKLKYTTKSIPNENTIILKENHPMYGEQRRDEYTKEFDLAAAIRFRLNMSVNIDKNLKFNGRMLYMNSTQAHQRLCILSRDIKSVSSSSAFDIDRAYIDYTPNPYSDYAFTFSFGLLPTSGGTPMQYAQNEQRKSVFPALVFDMNTYGIIGTQKLAEKTFVRAVAAKAYTKRANFYPYQCNRENIDNANVFGLYADTKLHFLGNSLISFGVNILHNFKAHPYLGPDVDGDNANYLGDMLTFGLGIDIEKFLDTQSTLFLHTALSNPHGNGKSDDYQIITDADDTQIDPNDPGFTTSTYATGKMLDSNGYAVYTGVHYHLNSTFDFGAEYNYGSKYWFSGTQGAEDMYNKLSVRGHVVEVYTTWKMHKNLYAKLGYIHLNELYTGSGWHFAEPSSKDAVQSVGYLNLDFKF